MSETRKIAAILVAVDRGVLDAGRMEAAQLVRAVLRDPFGPLCLLGFGAGRRFRAFCGRCFLRSARSRTVRASTSACKGARRAAMRGSARTILWRALSTPNRFAT